MESAPYECKTPVSAPRQRDNECEENSSSPFYGVCDVNRRPSEVTTKVNPRQLKSVSMKHESAKQDIIFTVGDAADTLGVAINWVQVWVQQKRHSKAFVGLAERLSEVEMLELTELATEQHRKFDSRRKANRQASKRMPANKDSFVDDGKQDTFTVAQIASLWNLSRDTIQRLFQDEPGVVVLGDKNPRGKRRRVTLRVPRAVMDRVKKRRSNPG